MPKFTYSAAKCIEQSSGSGFYVNDTSILEEVQTCSAASDAANTHGITILDGSGANLNSSPVTLADLASASNYGQRKIILCSNATNSPKVTLTSAKQANNSTALAAITFNATTDVAELVWVGTHWLLVTDIGLTLA